MSESEKKKILVIDDEPSTTHIIKTKLEAKNIVDVTTLNDSTLAMSTIEELLPDIIITDVLMPNLDGKKLVEIIRSSKFSHIPIIVLSSRKKMEDYFKTVQRVEFVEKTDPDQMISKLEDLIKNIFSAALPEKKKPFDAPEMLTRISGELGKYTPDEKDKDTAKPEDLLLEMKNIISEYEPPSEDEKPS